MQRLNNVHSTHILDLHIQILLWASWSSWKGTLEVLYHYCITPARSQGVATHTTLNLSKGPLLVTKWTIFLGGRGCRKVKGVGSRSPLWVQKVHFCGVLHHPKIDPGYGPGITPVAIVIFIVLWDFEECNVLKCRYH